LTARILHLLKAADLLPLAAPKAVAQPVQVVLAHVFRVLIYVMVIPGMTVMIILLMVLMRLGLVIPVMVLMLIYVKKAPILVLRDLNTALTQLMILWIFVMGIPWMTVMLVHPMVRVNLIMKLPNPHVLTEMTMTVMVRLTVTTVIVQAHARIV
jgi:hypothetical protein